MDWIAQQKKVFTRWCNAYLKLRQMHVDDLYKELQSGLVLHHLLEILCNQPAPRKINTTPKLRIHRLENLKTAFDFMKAQGVASQALSLISGTDIADGNVKLTLGLTWILMPVFYRIFLPGSEGKTRTDPHQGFGLHCFFFFCFPPSFHLKRRLIINDLLSSFTPVRISRLGKSRSTASPGRMACCSGPSGPSTFCRTLFQIERAALHSYGPDAHSC